MANKEGERNKERKQKKDRKKEKKEQRKSECGGRKKETKKTEIRYRQIQSEEERKKYFENTVVQPMLEIHTPSHAKRWHTLSPAHCVPHSQSLQPKAPTQKKRPKLDMYNMNC